MNKKKVILTVLISCIFAFLGAAVWFVGKVAAGEYPELPWESGADEDLVYTIRLGGEEYYYDNDIETYLIIGTDKSGYIDENGEPYEPAEDEEYQGGMADFLALLILDNTEDTYAVLQLNRDTMTDITMLLDDDTIGEIRVMQLCTAQAYGSDAYASCDNTSGVVSTMLGELDIFGYYSIPMEAIIDLNDAIGGVTVTIEDDFSVQDPTLVQGETIKLTNEQAYNYLSVRWFVGDGENVSRMRRQVTYLNAFIDQAMQGAKDDPQVLVDIYNSLESEATTDIESEDMVSILTKIPFYENLGIFSFEGEVTTEENLEDGLVHAMFYPDEDSVLDIMTKLFSLRKTE